MMRSKPIPGRTLGWRDSDLAAKPFAKYWQPQMRRLPAHAVDAVNRGGVAEPLIPGLERAAETLFGAKPFLENGYTLTADGRLHINIWTDMPGVSPAMIDWWFAWHGDDAAKYKLWHPEAHVHAQWTDPLAKSKDPRQRYIGNTSIVDEYIGTQLLRLAIRFIPPREIGLTHPSLDDPEEATAICAQSGLADRPVDAGFLCHHVRRTPTGSEMRSRFWIGGPYAAARAGSGIAGQVATRLAKTLLRPTDLEGRSLLIHCAEEMQHLASFLPALYAEFRD